jgi:type II secretory pathway pseudopilin PulG
VIGQLILRLPPLREQRAYALTELVTVLAIMTIVLGGLTTLFVAANTAEVDMRKRFDAQQEARLAIDALRREVHCASAVPTVLAHTVTLTLPTGCPSGSGDVTWRMQNVGTSRYQLWRDSGATSKRYADYLVLENAFSYTAPTTDSRAKLSVEFAVDVDLADTIRPYTLEDDLVLRNTSPTG